MEYFILFKFGDVKTIEFFAGQLATLIRDELSKDGIFNPQEWIILHRSYISKHSTELLGEILISQLGIPSVDVIQERHHSNYTLLSTKLERERVANKSMYLERPQDIQGKKVIIYDDVMSTGGIMKELARVVREAGAGDIRPFVVANLSPENYDFERQAYRHFIDHRSQRIEAALNNKDNTITQTAIKYFMRIADESPIIFRQIIERVADRRRLDILEQAKKYLQIISAKDTLNPIPFFNLTSEIMGIQYPSEVSSAEILISIKDDRTGKVRIDNCFGSETILSTIQNMQCLGGELAGHI